jgi:hypothetical protein
MRILQPRIRDRDKGVRPNLHPDIVLNKLDGLKR